MKTKMISTLKKLGGDLKTFYNNHTDLVIGVVSGAVIYGLGLIAGTKRARNDYMAVFQTIIDAAEATRP